VLNGGDGIVETPRRERGRTQHDRRQRRTPFEKPAG